MRYFLELSYIGTGYSGWQVQPGDPSVQATLQDILALLFRREVPLTGCGRTDAGVHARGYMAHLDWDGPLPEHFLHRLNQLLPATVAVHRIIPVHEDAHARFDAVSRTYRYRLHLDKNPVGAPLSWHFPYAHRPDPERLNAAATLLLNYRDFAPFCKTGTDARTRICHLGESFWTTDRTGRQYTYRITADRFLRGMIRLIVGMCLRVSEGKTTLEDVKTALDHQVLLEGSWSVPPDGLMLEGIRYPYL